VVLIRDDDSSQTPVSTFDYTDLNAYLLVVVGLASPSEEYRAHYDQIATKARERSAIPLKDIQVFSKKESLVVLPGGDYLTQAMEIFGSGVHRILVANQSGSIVGILSQLKLVEFFWAEAVNFPSIEKLYPVQIRDLGIGSQQILAVK
jgi:CBS-domain-containing membrane protein